jgi:hypothetical protein
MANEYEHIFLRNAVKARGFKGKSGGGGNDPIPRDRESHANMLLSRFETIRSAESELRKERSAQSLPTRSGTYLEFSIHKKKNEDDKRRPGKLSSFEDVKKGIRLISVREVEDALIAIVYIPRGQEGFFLNKVNDYADTNQSTITGKPKHEPLVTSINDVRLALLRSFWPSSQLDFIPGESSKWCEAWIRISETKQRDAFNQNIAQFKRVLTRLGIESKGNIIRFPERAIMLIKANEADLTELYLQSDLLAELRVAQEVAGFWTREYRRPLQQDWIDDLLRRIDLQESSTTICILDSGANNGHPLLQQILREKDCLTINPHWGSFDSSSGNGHGTLMAGIAGYGDLQAALESSDQIALRHRLCSVKLLPDIGQSPKELWGDFTSQAISLAEVNNPNEYHIFCMAVTSNEDIDQGKPSSWSGAVDQLTFGDEIIKRLIIISGGNINDSEAWSVYPIENQSWPVQNPAQAWNALTVGAFTQKVQIQETGHEGYAPLAPYEGLSPFSSTSNSRCWNTKLWPIKPEVVFEGGNVAKTESGGIILCGPHEDLEILTTSGAFSTQYFTTFGGTSPASAQAAWLAAQVAGKYPNAWPETIRGLIIHSASWTKSMLSQFNVTNKSRKKDIQELLRCCGYGVPNFNRVQNSFDNAFTFIAEEEIQPFARRGGRNTFHEMHMYDLPWPQDVLLSLGEEPVTMKITLSYFIEPGPGEIGWEDRYRYPSYALRFEVIDVGEAGDEFEKRVNPALLKKGEKAPKNYRSDRWKIGDARNTGSVHSDYWEGTAAELAVCNKIAITPLIGWWRERSHLGKLNSVARYSLIVSLETPAQNVSLYSAVKSIIDTRTTITIEN